VGGAPSQLYIIFGAPCFLRNLWAGRGCIRPPGAQWDFNSSGGSEAVDLRVTADTPDSILRVNDVKVRPKGPEDATTGFLNSIPAYFMLKFAITHTLIFYVILKLFGRNSNHDYFIIIFFDKTGY
jgi:hypothetical protein